MWEPDQCGSWLACDAGASVLQGTESMPSQASQLPQLTPFTREIELLNNKPAHRPLLHRIALAAPANN
ncbi:hypothetical protein C7A10_03980 [Pseudomonas fluorescens]|uniref:Uncharacterized protein n=1 Tax=Pseudomonas fluorescens TaxID=294 RepID=A0A2T0IHH1_PSEFL|nr:hypothetical protein C7A10_03980 [Pseudomonas fluorescens]